MILTWHAHELAEAAKPRSLLLLASLRPLYFQTYLFLDTI